MQITLAIIAEALPLRHGSNIEIDLGRSRSIRIGFVRYGRENLGQKGR